MKIKKLVNDQMQLKKEEQEGRGYGLSPEAFKRYKLFSKPTSEEF